MKGHTQVCTETQQYPDLADPTCSLPPMLICKKGNFIWLWKVKEKDQSVESPKKDQWYKMKLPSFTKRRVNSAVSKPRMVKQKTAREQFCRWQDDSRCFSHVSAGAESSLTYLQTLDLRDMVVLGEEGGVWYDQL